MDSDTLLIISILILILGIFSVIVVGSIIHEKMETVYDKCLDACDNLDEISEPGCISQCNQINCNLTFKEDVSVQGEIE